jgi:hypothetical protein
LAVLNYDQATGIFTWKVRRGRGGAGRQAGTLSDKGYRFVPVGSQRYKAHRLAWLIVHGEWPADTINHLNGQKDDNRIANLEAVSLSENTRHAHRTGLTSNAGEGNGRAKLTAENVSEILASPCSATVLAARYGVTNDTITNIRAGKSWRCVPRVTEA